MKSKPIVACACFLAALLFFSCHCSSNSAILKGNTTAEPFDAKADPDEFLKTPGDSLENYRDLTGLLDEIDSSTQKVSAAPDPGTGRIVPKVIIQSCLDTFDLVMRTHAIDSKALQNANVSVKDIILITRSECFRGKELKKFMQKAARLRHHFLNIGSGKHLAIDVKLGIYTSEYLTAIHEDQGKVGRIAVFLITHEWEKDPNGKGFIILPDVPEDDPNGFDFGGLKP